MADTGRDERERMRLLTRTSPEMVAALNKLLAITKRGDVATVHTGTSWELCDAMSPATANGLLKRGLIAARVVTGRRTIKVAVELTVEGALIASGE